LRARLPKVPSMKELIFRFLIGGAIVSSFAMLGEILRPKSFAGLFGAAPSIALATIGMTIAQNGKVYAAVEARSMCLGAIAFCCYATTAGWLLMRYKLRALAVTIALLPIWFGVSIGLRFLVSRVSP
jgi:hypothetical protein